VSEAIISVSSVLLQVTDLDRSVAFYEGLLGLEVSGRAGPFVFLDGGSVILGLRRSERVDPGDTEIVLEVSDVDAAYRDLSDRIEFRVAPRLVTEAGDRGLYAADFHDPDGHILSISGWKRLPGH
jgi:catechol 2,3-dioxygenase-like lactoylglutathione lyase family enzyme